MPQDLNLDLSPSGAVTATASSASVEVGPVRNVALLLVNVTSIAADGGRLRLTLETSDDDTIWVAVTDPVDVETVAQVALAAEGLGIFVRAKWTFEGTITEARFTARGAAYASYCTPSDVKAFGLPAHILQETSTATLVEQCLAASDEADGYLAAAYTLPLTSWSHDLTLHCAKMAIRYTLDSIGWQPNSPVDPIETAFGRAISWLKGVASGPIRPPKIVDSAPEEFEAVSVVVSRPKRERFF